jgi:pimeloyl-ACP methyl ester carboxylesterase
VDVTPTPPPETTTSADGTRIAFERIGNGPPIVFVGGALTDRSGTREFAPALATSFTEFHFDRRGRGDSGDGPVYAVDREIEDLAAVIDVAGGAPFLYGHSSGGLLALRAAAAGVPIGRIAIYEPPIRIDRPPAGISAFGEAIRTLVAEQRRSEAVEKFLLRAVNAPPEIIERAKDRPSWSKMEGLAHTLLYDIAVSGTDGTAPFPSLAELSTPVLVLDGGLSDQSVRATAAAVAVAIAHARHATIPDQRHNPAAEDLGPVLAGFFSSPNV